MSERHAYGTVTLMSNLLIARLNDIGGTKIEILLPPGYAFEVVAYDAYGRKRETYGALGPQPLQELPSATVRLIEEEGA